MAPRLRLAVLAAAFLIAAPALAQEKPGAVEAAPRNDALAQALAHLDIAIVEARTASGDAFRAFAALDVKTYDPVLGHVKSAREVLYEMAERFAASRDAAGKAWIAQTMLGPGWAGLLPYLNKGPPGVQELEARRSDRR